MTPPPNGPAPDPTSLVDDHWPHGGPHTPEHVLTAMETAAQLIRYANIATLDGVRLAPADLDATLASTKILLDRLPQLVEQLGRQVRGYADQPGAVADDRPDGNGAITARRAANDLLHSDLIKTLRFCSTALERARIHTRHLRTP